MALPPVTIADPLAALAGWLVVLPVVVPLLFGACLIMARRAARLQVGIALFGLAVLIGINAALLCKVAATGPVAMMLGHWPPPFGIAFTADLLGVLLVLAAAISGLAACWHAGREIGLAGRRAGFYPLLMLLMAGVSGAFLTGDLFNLYVWFEVLLMASFGLMVNAATPARLDGGLKYAVLNLIGATLFLIAIGGLYAVFGTLTMADLARKTAAGETAVPMALAGLLVLAFAVKAAAFPVHFWLPASYHTPPAAVSALLGGLMTKVGIYALLRVMVMILPQQRAALGHVIAASAILTMLFGGFGALAQSDMRRMLCFVVISGTGAMLAGVALGTVAGVAGAIFYAVHSVILVAALYLAADMSHRTGLAGLALVLFFSASGLPPLAGFWPKLLLLDAAIDAGAWGLAAALLLSGLLVTIALVRLFGLSLWRPAPAVPGRSGAPAPSMTPLAGMTLLIVLTGLFPESLIGLSQRAGRALVEPAGYIGSVFPEGVGR